MISRISRVAAWLILAALIFVTVSPISERPPDVTTLQLDRALAFATLTVMFLFAYPRHFIVVSACCIVGASALEALQYLSPTRHPGLIDAAVKSTGALFGAVLFYGFSLIRRRSNARRA